MANSINEAHQFYIRMGVRTTSKIHHARSNLLFCLKKSFSVLALGTTIRPRMFISCLSSAQKNFQFAIFTLGLLLFGFDLSGQSVSGLPFVRTFHTVEYQAGIQNWAITQDRRGI